MKHHGPERGRGWRVPAAALAVLLPLAACSSPEAVQAAEPATRLFERAFVVGASMSTGMQLDADLATVVDAMVRVEHGPVETRADLFLFANSPAMGAEQIDAALANDATLLVALDFLFWFGYGVTDDRIALLDVGLGLLDRVPCPIVVSDFPNMEEAVGKMLAPEQMPTADELAALNAHLAAWVARNPRVTMIPMAECAAAMRAGDAFSIGRYTWPADSNDLVLQEDQLHPTLEGLAALAHLMGVMLVERGVVTERDVDLDLRRVLGELGEEFESAEMQD